MDNEKCFPNHHSYVYMKMKTNTEYNNMLHSVRVEYTKNRVYGKYFALIFSISVYVI